MYSSSHEAVPKLHTAQRSEKARSSAKLKRRTSNVEVRSAKYCHSRASGNPDRPAGAHSSAPKRAGLRLALRLAGMTAVEAIHSSTCLQLRSVLLACLQYELFASSNFALRTSHFVLRPLAFD
jgi:hypothetical protein